ncbi:MAG: threonylcarbamoyl-AMP synthase [Clostridia bacterium]|nr:threonylcarbamoyl-AMP synthase [Clostridia bacterium]
MEKYLDFKNKIEYDKLKEMGGIIKRGEIVIFPTETVYAIGTNGLDEETIKKLYKIKQRPLDKPTSLLVSDMEMVKNLARDITEKEYKLMKTFFPGPLTIILKKKDIVPNILTGNTNTIGIRMPENEIARKLIEYANVPIAAPSANIANKPSGTNIENIINDFKETVDYYIDGGESKIGLGSTIVKIENNVPIILREGSITKEQIYECLK